MVLWLAMGTACTEESPTDLTLSAGDFTTVVETDEGGRNALVHVPPGLDANTPVPLVVVLHGAGQTAEGVRTLAQFDGPADQYGFITVYPEGRDRTWRVVGSNKDRDFLTGVVDRIASELPVDRSRVYAVGISQGALMTHRMGCSATSPITAIASVAASLSRFFDNCPGKGPVPAIFFLGSQDPIYPWDEQEASALGHYGGVGTAAAWATRIGCPGDGQHTILPAGDADGIQVEHWRFGGCPFGQVELYGMIGGGHTWPGSAQGSSAVLGANTQDIDASALILEFLLAL